MSRLGKQDSKNFGFGRDMAFAGKMALQDHFGDGHFASVASHAQRFSGFADFMHQQHGIRDMRQVEPGHVEHYAASLGARVLEASTRQNAISTINVVLTHASAGAWRAMSPRTVTGAARCNIRSEAPPSQDTGKVESACQSMRDTGLGRAAAALGLARTLGVRSREAALADLSRWSREATRLGKVNIQEGAKGGRSAPRWVPVSSAGRAAISSALAARPSGSRNLLASGESYARWVHTELKAGREHLHAAGIKGYHDARAAYACDRYQELTGYPVPVRSGGVTDRQADMEARQVIAQELGHGRVDVVASYIGSRR